MEGFVLSPTDSNFVHGLNRRLQPRVQTPNRIEIRIVRCHLVSLCSWLLGSVFRVLFAGVFAVVGRQCFSSSPLSGGGSVRFPAFSRASIGRDGDGDSANDDAAPRLVHNTHNGSVSIYMLRIYVGTC